MSSPLAQPLPWDLVSDAYEAEITPQFEAYAKKAIDLAQVPRNSRVVDIATGPGTLAMLASAAGVYEGFHIRIALGQWVTGETVSAASRSHWSPASIFPMCA